jgi:hypothetical protein
LFNGILQVCSIPAYALCLVNVTPAPLHFITLFPPILCCLTVFSMFPCVYSEKSCSHFYHKSANPPVSLAISVTVDGWPGVSISKSCPFLTPYSQSHLSCKYSFLSPFSFGSFSTMNAVSTIILNHQTFEQLTPFTFMRDLSVWPLGNTFSWFSSDSLASSLSALLVSPHFLNFQALEFPGFSPRYLPSSCTSLVIFAVLWPYMKDS